MTGTGNAMEGRVVDLELRFMKLERFVSELSDTVVQQQRTIDALTREVRRLRERSVDAEPEPAGEVPPHY